MQLLSAGKRGPWNQVHLWSHRGNNQVWNRVVPQLQVGSQVAAESPAWVLTFTRRASYSCLTPVRCKFSALTLVSSKRKPLHPRWDHGSDSRGAAGEVKQLDGNSGFVLTLTMEKWKGQGCGLECARTQPLARLSESREEPWGCWVSGDGWGTARTSPRAGMALCASWSTFLWSTAKLQGESRAVVEILADLQTQRQQIPPGHCTVSYTAGNKAQIPATPSL